jgi:WS/DGAT/MGAT family acyltransferase
MNWRALDPLDSAFITLEVPSTPLHIGAIIELETNDDLTPNERFEMIRANIASRIHEIPSLTKRVIRAPLDLAWPVLADDPDFDVSEHVIRRALPAPGDTDQLNALVGRVMAQELLPDRPLWEFNVIEGLEGGNIAIVMKVHHALADGVSGALTFAGLFDITPDVREPAPASTEPVGALPTSLDMLGHTAIDLLKRPGALLDVVAAGLSRVADVLDKVAGAVQGKGDEFAGVALPNVLEAARTSLNGTPSHSKVFTRLQTPLADAKRAAKTRGATVTDFIMACCSGALKRLLDERGETLTKDLIAFVPINVRRQGAEAEMGNQFSAMLSGLRTDLDDREERIAALAQASKKQGSINREHNAALLMNLASAVGPTVTSFAGRALSDMGLFDVLPPIANVTVSSVPGPPIPLYLSGYLVTSAAPLGPLMAGLALNITVLGYVDSLEWGILACSRHVPDIEKLRTYIQEEADYYLSTPAPRELDPK